MAEPPRSLAQRIADTRARLERDADAWVATAAGDRPWLVPLSFLWWHGRLLLATESASRSVRNASVGPVVRLAVGQVRDVVLIDGTVEVGATADLPQEVVDAYRGKHGNDPRGWADAALWVTPTRIKAWREENELAGRLLMRDGR